MYPSQRSYLKSIVIGVGIRSFNVAGRAKQINIDKFVDLPGLMWTGPQFRPSRIGRANVSCEAIQHGTFQGFSKHVVFNYLICMLYLRYMTRCCTAV